MILAIASHGAGLENPAYIRRDGLLFLDAGLSILGAPPQRYRAYADAIRSEYDWMSAPRFASGRSHEMRARFERQARANVPDEMTSLATGDRYSRNP